MKWLLYVIVLVYIYRAVCAKSDYGLTVDPVIYEEEGFLKVGEPKRMNCKAANRNQKVEWIYPNGTVVKRIPGNRIHAQEHFVQAFKGRTPALVLIFTRAEVQDTGVYQCRSGDKIRKVSLCVIEPSVFVETAVDVTADIGRSITLSCQAKGDPEPRLVWNRNGETITDEDTSSKYRIMTKYNIQGFEGLLTIISLDAEDSGVYSCVSIQEKSQVEDCNHITMHNITLNVNFAPVFEGANETNVFGKLNQEVDIVCSAKGFPAPTYRLFKELPDDSLLEFNQKQIRYDEDNNQAILRVIANSTTLQNRFKCLAINDQGTAEKYITVVKMERPSKIDAVEIFAVNNKIVIFNLTWYDEIVFPITAIEVQSMEYSSGDSRKPYSKDSAWRKSKKTEATLLEDDELLRLLDSGTIRGAVADLEPETSYWMRVRTTNEIGASPWSDVISVSTTSEDEEEETTTEASIIELLEELDSSDDFNHVDELVFYGIFFAGGLILVVFLCRYAMRKV